MNNRSKILTTFAALTFAASAMAGSATKNTAKLQEINRNPSKFSGKKVSVQGEVVHKSADGRSFVIDGQGLINDRILVLTANKKNNKPGEAKRDEAASQDTQAAKINTNEQVSVTGTVQNLTYKEIGTHYDADLDPELQYEFVTTLPVILSDSQSVQIDSQRAH